MILIEMFLYLFFHVVFPKVQNLLLVMDEVSQNISGVTARVIIPPTTIDLDDGDTDTEIVGINYYSRKMQFVPIAQTTSLCGYSMMSVYGIFTQ